MTVSAPGSANPVLLYDGECGLCNRVVRLLLRLDQAQRLRFAPLQSAPAQAYLRAQGLPTDDFDSLVFVNDWERPAVGDYALRTDGVIAALQDCGTLGEELAAVLAWFPRRLRDAGYRFVARVRYRVFGEWKPRPLPRAEWSARFLA